MSSKNNGEMSEKSTPGGSLVSGLIRRAKEIVARHPLTQAPANSATSSNEKQTTDTSVGRDVDDRFPALTPEQRALPGANAPVAIRMLIFWKDGFSVGEGSVMLYSDPFSQKILEEINKGTAPPNILNVHPGQRVDVRVFKYLDKLYDPALVPRLSDHPASALDSAATTMETPTDGTAGEGMREKKTWQSDPTEK